MFTGALFTIAKRWKKKTKCPSTDKGINKMEYVQAMEYYPATKGNADTLQCR